MRKARAVGKAVVEASSSSSAAAGTMAEGPRVITWFRKALRVRDNPALAAAIADKPSALFPVFIIDPHFVSPERVGLRRFNFLLESLHDLDRSLRRLNSRLLVIRGNPIDVLPDLFTRWRVTKLTFERDTEPYARSRDAKVVAQARAAGVKVACPVGHTLYDPDQLITLAGGKAPLTYQAFCKIVEKAGKPPALVEVPTELPPFGASEGDDPIDFTDEDHSIPTLEELGYPQIPEDKPTPWKGGESEGLKIMEQYLAQKNKVARFEKPKGNPCKINDPETTVLSPYLKFGCVSARTFYYELLKVYSSVKSHTQPPVSLLGQLYWREFFYTVGYHTPNFDKMVGNPICKQIPWSEDDDLLKAWEDGRTGYPWIDAAMTQLRDQGWLHHLARHAVACFLTRGDLWVHWTKGRDVFDKLLLDADWSINNANWMWLSASSFFYQYHRVYSPITFAKKYDPEGNYIRHFLPVLKNMPTAYIFEPWKAPLKVQKEAGCIIGVDYPKPIVDHAKASAENKDRMGVAYAANKAPASKTSSRATSTNQRGMKRKRQEEEEEEDI